MPAVQFNTSGVLSDDLLMFLCNSVPDSLHYGDCFFLELYQAPGLTLLLLFTHPAVNYRHGVFIAYSTDLVMLLVAWELMSLPTYALAAFSTGTLYQLSSSNVLYVRSIVFCNFGSSYWACLWHYGND